MTDEPAGTDRDPFYSRAGLIITAANVVTALLATAAIRDRPGIGLGGWFAIAAFVIVMVLCLDVLAPQKG